MRRVLALALVVLALSGCSAGTADDPAPPNADPNGQQTLPPAGPPSTSTGPPTASGSNSTTSAGSDSATGGPASFGQHDAEDSATDPDFPGLFVGGRLQGSGAQLRVEAAANNAGQRDYRVPDGDCKQPWSDVLRDADGDVVAHRQPLATCGAFGLEPFAAGEFLATALSWNGTLWDATSGSFVAAPTGTYTWDVTFDAYSGGSGSSFDDHAAMTMSFTVDVE